MRVIIAAAGTAGHINPGIAIANKIKKEKPSSEIMFLGTDRGLENDLVPRAGYELETIEAYGLSKNLTLQSIKNNLKTLKGVRRSKKNCKRVPTRHCNRYRWIYLWGSNSRCQKI
ncbi:MAG: glycosyltransferase [Clostridia bacterium]|nr:glycosyltransferase [Clostridia bacterium]